MGNIEQIFSVLDYMDESADRKKVYQVSEEENHLTNCVKQLVRSEDFSNSVSMVLQTVLNYYRGERAYLFDFDWEREIGCNTYEICAPGVIAEIDNLQEVSMDDMRFWINQFQQRDAIVIEDLNLIKGKSDRQNEYEILAGQGISSIIAVPFYFSQIMAGFIGVDNPKEHFDNKDFLVNLAYFIGLEIEKHKIVHELKDEGCRDALTGIYNRKGFDQFISTMPVVSHPVGFGIIDIDSFKLINDSYGHATGDLILKEIGELLTGVLRDDDKVFRLGGDEFAVLLNNCTENGWNTICTKIQWIHSTMSEKHKDIAVTLSMGICFTTNRINEKIYKKADELLYEAKRNGRAGCVMVDDNTGKKRSWYDDLSFHMKNILEYNNTGRFRIEFPECREDKPYIFCSSVAREMFDFPQDATPKECYQKWKEGIDPSYLDAVKDMEKLFVKGIQAECTYLWNHPHFGKIYIRTSGIGENANGRKVIYGYHHSLQDIKLIERQDDSKLLISAISSIYDGAYYINLETDHYVSLKRAANQHLLQLQEKNIRSDFKKYIDVLVAAEYQDHMLGFCDFDTLQERLKNQTHLDCEYQSAADHKWYRGSFLPVKWNRDGKLTHVLYEIVPLDTEAARESEKNSKNARNIESLYNNVPGGLVMYEWDGISLSTLYTSRYYKKRYGDNKIFTGTPEYKRVHPDDYASLHQAILIAINDTHNLSHVYRTWNDNQNKYIWEKVDAVCAPQVDGTTLIYAMYSDVTIQKEAELRLQKRQMSLAAALNAANQLCYEYDPVLHTGVCFTDENFFGLPKYIADYPDSLKNIDLFHPDDTETFIQTARQMDMGNPNAQCDVRIKKAGKYSWYSCRFDSYFDPEKGRNVAILNVVDISIRMEAVQQYEERMQTLMAVKEDGLCMALINVNQDSFETIYHQEQWGSEKIDDSAGYRRVMMRVPDYIIGEEAKTKYRTLFSRQNLLNQAEKGNMHIQMEYLAHFGKRHYEWLSTGVDLVKNPITGEIGGVVFFKSFQTDYMINRLLEKSLEHEYLFAATIFIDTDEFYLYNSEIATYTPCMQNFWKVALKAPHMYCSEEVVKQLKEFFVKDKILKQIEATGEASFSFDSMHTGELSRLEIRYTYMDEEHTMLLGTMQDITDSALLNRYRYDSEHDLLTNFYNRSKFVIESEKILKKHPEEQFAVVHFDIRNFHRYNTFFGETAGDQLLCDIADVLRKLAEDYPYSVYGRVDADVFAALTPFNKETFEAHAQRIFQEVRSYRDDFLVEPKVGIYLIDDRSMPIESMITRASMAAGDIKNNHSESPTAYMSYYNEAMEEKMVEEQQVLNDMYAAIKDEQFQVYLQAKYALRTGLPIGAEALVRWKHPERGVIPPSQFIPIFEGNGFIMTLDRYMWEHTCQILCRWRNEGRTIVPISVNVSRISIFNPTTVEFLKDLVKRYRIEPRYLELELTESAYVENQSVIRPRLLELQKYGFRVLMDDFGSGYSSLNMIKDLPVDVLKLDMKFLNASEQSDRGCLVLSSIVRMAKLLNLTVIAEGVEEQEQADYLRSIGCEYVQGFLYARPVPVEKFEENIFNQQIGTEEAPYQLPLNISHMLIKSSSQDEKLGENLPQPLVIVEYDGQDFVCLRMNPLFMQEFGIKEDYRSFSIIFKEGLSEHDCDKMQRAFAKCREIKESVCFRMEWLDDRTTKNKYFVTVAYNGEIGVNSVFVIVFTNETVKNFIE